MKLLAQIGVILGTFSRAIYKYALWPMILLTLLAFLFPKYFYVLPYILLARIVSITIITFIIYILVFGLYEIIMNKCIQKKIGEKRGYKSQNALSFYPINIDKVIRIKRIGRIRKGVPGAFLTDGFNLLSNMPLTVFVIVAIVSLSFLLGF